jgi:hypothetical protein
MMKNFKGFGDWIEIFKGGKQIDSNGREHDGDALVDRAVSTFDAARHEPPVVVGHPKDNSPAFGWVQGLKRSGNMLMAKFKDVVPEFEAVARQGLYKKKSASFYPDGRLRHVGFLGAAPPAVKGLADLKFEDDADSICFESNIELKTQKKEGNAMKFSEFMEIFKFWKAAEEDPDLDLSAITVGKKQSAAEPSGAFTEADIETAKKEAADAERTKVEAEFAEKKATAQREARNQEISTWCEGMVNAGKIAPAWIKAGLPQIFEFLAANDDVIEFGEEKKKSGHYDWLKNFFENEMPKLIEFKEIATRGLDAGDGGDSEKREKLISDFQEHNKEASYKDAVLAVSEKHPDLFKDR